MQVAGIYSFKNGEETIKKHYRTELEEVLQTIESVDAENCKTSSGKRKTARGKVVYNPLCLKEAFKTEFFSRGWENHSVLIEYSTKYYVPGYTPRKSNESEPDILRDMDFVKQKLGIEVQFGKYASMVYDICAKMTIFANMGVIDCGVEIVPIQALAEKMPTGVSYFEQLVWDLKHRSVSNIDIPMLIFGIDTDGMKPRDLKIAEARQPYLFLEG